MAGVDFETASLEVREALAFCRDDVVRLLPSLVKEAGLEEAALISTCNRTELYYVSPEGDNGVDPARILMKKAGLQRDDELWTRRGNDAAVEHLFSVAAGLMSMVKGEVQVLGQVKDAFRMATEAATTGPFLNRIFHAAFRAGKRVRAETSISEGAVSVSLAAVELAAAEAPRPLTSAETVVIGAGEMASLVVKHLVSKKAGKVRVANRTLANAECFAEPLGLETHGLDELRVLLREADIVISASACDGYLLTPQDFSHGTRPLFLVDIGIPRTISPDVGDISRCTLRNIDALNGRVEVNLKRREEEARRGGEIVKAEVAEAMKWVASRKNASLIHSLAEYMEHLRARELRRVCKDTKLTETERLQQLSTHIVKKITQPIIKKINDARAEGDEQALENYLGLLKEMYRI
jgi:glutamyl-tRNA reductase